MLLGASLPAGTLAHRGGASSPPPAPVAQWIERRFPKPCVAGSIPAGGTADPTPKAAEPVGSRIVPAVPPGPGRSSRSRVSCGCSTRLGGGSGSVASAIARPGRAPVAANQ